MTVFRLRAGLAAILVVWGVSGPAAAQMDVATVADRVSGSWYGRIEAPDRPPRYLEVLEVERDARGNYKTRVVFGWGDGTVSLTPADLTVIGSTVMLSLAPATGTSLRVDFTANAEARGIYEAAAQPFRPIRFERMRDATTHAALIGVWRATRGAETRIFEVKRVLATGGGAVLAVGRLGFAEKPDEMRQLVAFVRGEPGSAQLRWATAMTAVDLRQTKANELSGSFRRTDGPPEKADKIVFRQAVP
jgi:hypothetical protein